MTGATAEQIEAAARREYAATHGGREDRWADEAPLIRELYLDLAADVLAAVIPPGHTVVGRCAGCRYFVALQEPDQTQGDELLGRCNNLVDVFDDCVEASFGCTMWEALPPDEHAATADHADDPSGAAAELLAPAPSLTGD